MAPSNAWHVQIAGQTAPTNSSAPNRRLFPEETFLLAVLQELVLPNPADAAAKVPETAAADVQQRFDQRFGPSWYAATPLAQLQ